MPPSLLDPSCWVEEEEGVPAEEAMEEEVAENGTLAERRGRDEGGAVVLGLAHGFRSQDPRGEQWRVGI